MSSTYNDIRQAIEARLATEMALSPSYPVSYENVPFNPPNNTPWIKAQIRFGLNNYATLLGPTTGTNQQIGIVALDVFTPAGTGAGANYTIAERLKDLFDRQTVSQIIFDPADGPAIVEPANPAAYFQTQLLITFQAFVQ
tara:strand:+ start:619 stop:1038 length:420 start_codon:yes stop_codon:yes gene_type:complete